MRALLLVLLAAVGCDATSIPVHLTNPVQIGDRELVEEAAAVLDLDVEFVGVRYGAIQLELRDECVSGECGKTVGVELARCNDLNVWAQRSPVFVAHELGHVLGLDHESYAEGNLMERFPEGFELCETQLETIGERVELLNACR